MANEITISLSLSVNKPSVMSQARAMSVSGATFTMSGNYVCENTYLTTTGATALPLGSVTAPHFCIMHNLDAANFVKIRNGSGGADVLKIVAGAWNCFSFLDTSTPYIIADTAGCLVEYLLLSL